MDNYGEAFIRELERARAESLASKGLKPRYDVHRTMARFQAIVEELQGAGAPVSSRVLGMIAPATHSATLSIGATDYEVVFFNDTIKVFWRGREKTPMLYDALTPSRLNALARLIIERAVASSLANETRPGRTGPKLIKFPQP